MALDAAVELRGANGAQRAMKLRDFYREPGDTPQIETNLAPGEMITAIIVPDTPVAQRSHYLKVRDRASFEFALVSAAVAMQVDNGTIQDVRIAAGGVGTRPWHLPEVEAALRRQTAERADAARGRSAGGAGRAARQPERDSS